MIRYVTAQEVIALNYFLTERYSPMQIKGIKEPVLLDTAVNRPMQDTNGKEPYPDIISKAAALFESIIQNQCFHNANKRTAFVAVRQFLSYNGYDLIVGQQDIVNFVVETAGSNYTFDEVVSFIRNNSSPKKH